MYILETVQLINPLILIKVAESKQRPYPRDSPTKSDRLRLSPVKEHRVPPPSGAPPRLFFHPGQNYSCAIAKVILVTTGADTRTMGVGRGRPGGLFETATRLWRPLLIACMPFRIVRIYFPGLCVCVFISVRINVCLFLADGKNES